MHIYKWGTRESERYYNLPNVTELVSDRMVIHLRSELKLRWWGPISLVSLEVGRRILDPWKRVRVQKDM